LVLNRNDITFSLKLRRRWPLAANVNIYEGRSINKLQNSAIPLILKIGKIRNIRFVGNLILKIHINFFLMTTSLLWCHLFIEHSLSVYYFLHQFSIITHKW